MSGLCLPIPFLPLYRYLEFRGTVEGIPVQAPPVPVYPTKNIGFATREHAPLVHVAVAAWTWWRRRYSAESNQIFPLKLDRK